MTYFRLFPGIFATIPEQSQETLFLEFGFVEVGNFELQVCNVRERGTLSIHFVWSFRNFRTSFPFSALQEKYFQWRY